VWDIVACDRAGVRAIGLLSGGVSRDELENAGAEAVFENPRELADHLDDTCIAALANR
jgi:phosphoglycolate phosphatase-like HAD superfamily hydrolase